MRLNVFCCENVFSFSNRRFSLQGRENIALKEKPRGKGMKCRLGSLLLLLFTNNIYRLTVLLLLILEIVNSSEVVLLNKQHFHSVIHHFSIWLFLLSFTLFITTSTEFPLLNPPGCPFSYLFPRFNTPACHEKERERWFYEEDRIERLRSRLTQ